MVPEGRVAGQRTGLRNARLVLSERQRPPGRYNQAGINLQKAVDLGSDDARRYLAALVRRDDETYTKS